MKTVNKTSTSVLVEMTNEEYYLLSRLKEMTVFGACHKNIEDIDNDMSVAFSIISLFVSKSNCLSADDWLKARDIVFGINCDLMLKVVKGDFGNVEIKGEQK